MGTAPGGDLLQLSSGRNYLSSAGAAANRTRGPRRPPEPVVQSERLVTQGKGSVMIILLGFYKRRPDLTWEQFSDHWRNVHGPLLRDTPEASRYIKRYVQHHIRPRSPSLAGVGSLDFDGFSEAWFESAE